MFWYDLPTEFEDDLSFVLVMDFFVDQEMVQAVFERFPIISQDREIWLNMIIVESNYENMYDALPNWIRDAPRLIRRDRDLLLHACKYTHLVMHELDRIFQEDREFTEAIVEEFEHFALTSIPKAAQVLYPELVIKAISSYDEIPEHDDIADGLWSNLDVVEAYFRKEGRYHFHFPEALKNNKDFGRLVARFWSDNFEEATTVALRSDKSFMMEAVAETSYLFFDAYGPLRRDFDIAVAAVY